jgi:hypothetical protein
LMTLRAFAIYGIVAASWALSLFLHIPGQPWTVYSDVTSFWFREEAGLKGLVRVLREVLS